MSRSMSMAAARSASSLCAACAKAARACSRSALRNGARAKGQCQAGGVAGTQEAPSRACGAATSVPGTLPASAPANQTSVPSHTNFAYEIQGRRERPWRAASWRTVRARILLFAKMAHTSWGFVRHTREVHAAACAGCAAAVRGRGYLRVCVRRRAGHRRAYKVLPRGLSGERGAAARQGRCSALFPNGGVRRARAPGPGDGALAAPALRRRGPSAGPPAGPPSGARRDGLQIRECCAPPSLRPRCNLNLPAHCWLLRCL